MYFTIIRIASFDVFSHSSVGVSNQLSLLTDFCFVFQQMVLVKSQVSLLEFRNVLQLSLTSRDNYLTAVSLTYSSDATAVAQSILVILCDIKWIYPW